MNAVNQTTRVEGVGFARSRATTAHIDRRCNGILGQDDGHACAGIYVFRIANQNAVNVSDEISGTGTCHGGTVAPLPCTEQERTLMLGVGATISNCY